MQERKTNSTVTVSDPDAAYVLLEEEQLRYFSPFLAQDKTIGEAAEDTNSDPKTMYARVQRFLGCDLLKVVRETKRKGRATKVYRSVGDILYVPFINVEDLDEPFLKSDMFWQRQVTKGMLYALDNYSTSWGARFYRDDSGVLTSSLAKDSSSNLDLVAEGAPACISTVHNSIYLRYEDAKALQREILQLLERYQNRGGEQRYIMKIGFAPVPGEEKHIH